jgi:hypothetical protein
MKKLMASILVAGMALVPILGKAAEAPVPTSVERATKAAANVGAIYQQAKDLLAKALKEVDLTAANESKASADLKIATESGDKAKIKAAGEALEKAKRAAQQASRVARELANQVERLKVLDDKAKLAVVAAGSTDPKVAEKAADDAESLSARAVRIEKNIEQILKPRPPLEIIGVTIPSTTTSTTQPSPTPVGQRG